MSKDKGSLPPRIGFFHMLRDVLLASINKGQFPLAIVGVILIIIVARLPAQDLSTLVFTIISKLENWSLAGYLLFVITVGGWYGHARHQQRMFVGEIDRVIDERNKLQEDKLGGGKVKSSGG